MSSQFGIYSDSHAGIDEWQGLIYQRISRPPREMVEDIIPLLRELRDFWDMSPGAIGAWMAWRLVETDLEGRGLTGPGNTVLVREIQPKIDYFYKITPDRVEVHKVDEIYDWKMIAVYEMEEEFAEVPQEEEN